MKTTLSRIHRASVVIVLTIAGWLQSDGALARQLEPVQKRSCELPSELKGTSGHLLLRYTVNQAGKVNYVEPVFVVVDPPDREGALIESVKGCIRQWSYRATDTGGWARSSVELLLGLHYFKPAPAGGETIELPGGRSALKANFEEMRSVKLKLAEKLLAGADYAEMQEAGWALRTNVRRGERQSVLEAIRFALEGFDQLFVGAPALPASSRLTVLLFREEDQFNQIAAFDNIFRGPQPAGQYSPADQIAYTFASSRNHPLRLSIDAIVHEVTHHLIHQRLVQTDRSVPYWVDEGIASYIELVRPGKEGRLDRNRFERGRQAQGSFYWISRGDQYLDAFLQHHKAGTLPDLSEFARGRIGGLEPEISYGLSWILVHYLVNFENGRLLMPFQQWLISTAGAADDPGFFAAIGQPPEQLLPALVAHAQSMKRTG